MRRANGRCRQNVCEPGAVAREGANQRNGCCRRSGGSHGGDRLRQRFHRRKNLVAQARSLCSQNARSLLSPRLPVFSRSIFLLEPDSYVRKSDWRRIVQHDEGNEER